MCLCECALRIIQRETRVTSNEDQKSQRQKLTSRVRNAKPSKAHQTIPTRTNTKTYIQRSTSCALVVVVSLNVREAFGQLRPIECRNLSTMATAMRRRRRRRRRRCCRYYCMSRPFVVSLIVSRQTSCRQAVNSYHTRHIVD